MHVSGEGKVVTPVSRVLGLHEVSGEPAMCILRVPVVLIEYQYHTYMVEMMGTRDEGQGCTVTYGCLQNVEFTPFQGPEISWDG